MKPLLILIFISFFSPAISGQLAPYSDAWKQKILLEISKTGVEDSHLGCLNCLSKTRLKADSLFNSLPLDTALIYSRNESYAIKYYSFLRILRLSDSIAFEYLKVFASDMQKIDILSSCMSRTVQFNNLIVEEYGRFIYYKYRGQSFAIDGRSYWFDKPNRKLRKRKAKELEKLVIHHQIVIPRKYYRS